MDCGSTRGATQTGGVVGVCCALSANLKPRRLSRAAASWMFIRRHRWAPPHGRPLARHGIDGTARARRALEHSAADFSFLPVICCPLTRGRPSGARIGAELKSPETTSAEQVRREFVKRWENIGSQTGPKTFWDK